MQIHPQHLRYPVPESRRQTDKRAVRTVGLPCWQHRRWLSN